MLLRDHFSPEKRQKLACLFPSGENLQFRPREERKKLFTTWLFPHTQNILLFLHTHSASRFSRQMSKMGRDRKVRARRYSSQETEAPVFGMEHPETNTKKFVGGF